MPEHSFERFQVLCHPNTVLETTFYWQVLRSRSNLRMFELQPLEFKLATHNATVKKPHLRQNWNTGSENFESTR